MKAALFLAPGQPLVIEDIPDPEPLEGEVIIKVARCGVCGTDLHGTSGHGYRVLPPRSQLGHEFAGEVVALGKGAAGVRVGDQVAGFPLNGCGQCEYCRGGIDILCRSWTGFGRAIAEYVRLPARNALKLATGISTEDGALLEPLAVGRRGVRLANPRPESRVLVIGPGPIGLATLFWLCRLGVRRIAVLASTGRRRGLAEAMGAETFVIEGEDADHTIESALGGPPDIIFEAAGVPGVIARAIELVRPQGMVVALGMCTAPEPIVPAEALLKDLTLRFSIAYTREDYAACAEALEADAVRARSMVTDVVSLTGFPDAFEALRTGRGGGGKLVCDPGLDA